VAGGQPPAQGTPSPPPPPCHPLLPSSAALARSAEETLRKCVREREEGMVRHDVMKLEVRKLRDALSSKTDEVFGLENKS
jgi:hypothetical protein